MLFRSTLSDAARAALLGYDYPGNVRELESLVRRAALFARDGVIGLESLPPEVAAVLATAVELIGAALLALGLGARVGTAALLILNVTAAISYPDLSESGLRDHYFWGILLLLFLVHGPGRLSLDHLIRARVFKRSTN